MFPHLAKLDVVPVVLGNLCPRILLVQLDVLLGNLPRLLFLLLRGMIGGRVSGLRNTKKIVPGTRVQNTSAVR